MSPFTFYFKPQVFETLKLVLQSLLSPEEEDEHLETWIREKYPDSKDQKALRNILQKLGAIEFHHYCGSWFRELALGYDVQEAAGIDEDGQLIYENIIKLTSLGQQFIQTLFNNYVKPTLC